MVARRTLAMFLSFLAVTLAGCGLTAPHSSDGFADLDSLGITDVDNVMTISIGPTLLHFAARHIDDDPQTRALLRGLDGVRIRIYEIDGDADRVAKRTDRMQRRLQDQDWEPVMLVQESGERTYMLLKASGDRIHGLTVITADHDEAVIVNIMGDLRPEFFNDTMAMLEINDAPEVVLASTD
jgi:hypothetical protein